MEEEKIIMALATELAKRDLKALESFVCGMKFADAYKVLNGFNFSIWIDEEGYEGTSFDVNYKSITATIFRSDDGYCFVYDTCDVWLNDISSPIASVTIN